VKQLLVTTKEAWQSLGIGRTRFFEILSEGQIQAVRLGRKTLIPIAALEAFVAALPPRNSQQFTKKPVSTNSQTRATSGVTTTGRQL
jgi:excisionase family DNA binding protein